MGPLGLVRESLVLVVSNLTTFLPATLLTALPISFSFSLSLSTAALQAEIFRKHALLASIPAQGGSEVIHVRDELAADILSLLRRKALAWPPAYLISLLSTIAVVKSVVYLRTCRRPMCFFSAFISVKDAGTWRLVVTSIYVTVLKEVYDHISRVVFWTFLDWHVQEEGPMAAAVTSWAVFALLRAYVVGVLSMGMVVSVLEGKCGLEALVVGWDLVEENRCSGWVLGGAQAALTGGLGWWWQFQSKGGVGGGGGSLVQVGVFSVVIIVIDVLNTNFYFECKRSQDVMLALESSRVVWTMNSSFE